MMQGNTMSDTVRVGRHGIEVWTKPKNERMGVDEIESLQRRSARKISGWRQRTEEIGELAELRLGGE
jgi:hypothetical protein